MTQKIRQYEIRTPNISDHDQLYIEVQWGKRPKWGYGTWKLNNKILTDETFRQEIQSTIQIYKANKQFYDSNTGWDKFKMTIQKIAQDRATEINRQKKHDLDTLKTDIKFIKGKIDQNIDTAMNTKTLKILEEDLTQKRKDKTEGERMRAKQDKILLDERPTSYF